MMIVGGNSVADDFSEDPGIARARVFQILQREHGRALAQNHSGALAIERPAFLRSGRLQRIESDEDEFRNRIVAAGQYPLVFSRAHTLECMSDRVCSRSTSIGDDLT